MAINDSNPMLVHVENSKDFYITFLEMFKQQLKIKSATDIHVLTYMCLKMDYNSTKVALTTGRRKEICNNLKLANSHLSTSLRRLTELQLISGGNGEYEINPFLVWKGKTSEREKLLLTKGIEIRVRFQKTSPTDVYNPFNGGSKEFDK